MPGADEGPSRASAEFPDQVRGMFDRIAGVYDLMNTAMTAGLHHRWRERAADLARLEAGMSALDVCCGTGDLALELRRRVGSSGRVVGSDFSEPMLELARRKASERSLDVSFESADALRLPYANDCFDAVTVGFGARNLADLDRGIAEMVRVARPGGRIVILEITRPQRQPLATFCSLWFDRVVPALGTLAGDSAAYSYLPRSVRAFPEPEQLAQRMDASGLVGIRWLLLAGGIIAIHAGTKEPARRGSP